MGTPFKLDDLLGPDNAAAKPPQKKKADAGGYSLDEMLGPESTAAAPRPSAPDTGNVDFSKLPAPASAPNVAPAPAPAPRRGFVQRIGDALGSLYTPAPDAPGAASVPQGSTYDAMPDLSGVGEPDIIRQETRTMVPIPDRRTPAAKLAATRARMESQIGQRPDATQVRERGSIQATTEDAATATSGNTLAAQRAQFSPKAWRDVARRGMELANTLHAEGKHDEAEDVNKKAYNAQLIADGAADADTPGAIALSALLGIVKDPYAGQKTNLNAARSDPSLTFTPEEQQQQLGKNLPVATDRNFDVTKDVTAPLIGSLPVFMAGGAIERGLIGGASAGLEALNLPRAARIAEAIGAPLETTGLAEGVTPLAGRAGLRQAAENFTQNIPTLAARGATQGQVVGAAMAAREAQQTGGDPVQAAVGSVLGNAPIGMIGELLGGAATRAFGVADRSFTGAMDRVLGDRRAGIEVPVPPVVKSAVESARDVEGKTPIGDMTPEGQHATIAKALSALLDQKVASEPEAAMHGQAAPPPAGPEWWNDHAPVDPMVQGVEGYRTREAAAADRPLPTAAEVALEKARAGEPVEAHQEANAVVRMEQERIANERMQAEAAAQEQQARIEQAAAQRESERQGPKTLGETIEHASREAQAGEPMAGEYMKAIHDFASVSARMKDAGENIPEKLKVDWATAKQALNVARSKYGAQAGLATIGALAQADSDLTDEEKKGIGLASVGLVTTGKLGGIPESLRRNALDHIYEGATATREGWMEQFASHGVHFGEHFGAVDRALHDAAMVAGDPHAEIHSDAVKAIFAKEPGTGLTVQGADGALTQRALDTVDKIDTDLWGTMHSATPAEWATSLEAHGLPSHEADVVAAALRDEYADMKISKRDVIDSIAQGLVAAPAAPQTGSFYSRLGRAVETLQGKAWDAKRPAADWIGKLKGGGSYSKAELEMIMPKLELARDNKMKLDRADVMNMVDEAVPKIERHTLAFEKGPKGNAAHGDADEIVPIDDLHEGWPEPQLREQIDHREAAISQIESEMETRVDEAREAEESASENLRNRRRRIERELTENFPDHDEAGLDAAIEYLEDHVEHEHVPRGAVDKAFEKLYEDGNLVTLDEPHDPADFDIDVEETEKDGAPWFTATSSRSGKTYEGATKWEALAQAEHAGDYDTGHDGNLFPSSFTVKEEPFEEIPRFRVTRADGVVQEGNLHPAYTEDAFMARLRETHGADATIERVPSETPDPQWVMRDANGRELQSALTRDDLMDEYVRDNFVPTNSDDALGSIKDELSAYADDLAEYKRAESEHYWMTEGEYFENEHAAIEQHREEIGQIEEMIANQPEGGAEVDQDMQRALPAGQQNDPLLMPVKPRVTGKPQFESYQRIGGGTNYRELLNVWGNNQGEQYTRGHWRSTSPDVVSHVRIEDHAIDRTPGLEGARVEHRVGEGQHEKLVRDQIAEARAKRTKIEEKMAGIMAEYERMPAAVRDAMTDPRLNEMANEYQDLTNQTKTLADRETQLTEKLHMHLADAGVPVPPPSKVAVMIESQSDLAQDASKYGVRRVLRGEEKTKYEAANAELQERAKAIDKQVFTASNDFEHIEREWKLLARDQANEVTKNLEDARDRDKAYHDVMDQVSDPQEWLAIMDDPESAGSKDALANLSAIHPQFVNIITELKAASDRIDEAADAQKAIVQEKTKLAEKYGQSQAVNAVPEGPYTETKTAHALNAARFLMDSADRGYETIAWSDAPNRVQKAHLPMVASKLTYDEIIPSVMKSLLTGLGFKNVPIEHTYIRGMGHWKIDLTPEMRAAIRKNGLPVLGVLAAMAMPSDAQAQDGKGNAANGGLYASAVGGLAAGTLIGAMMASKKLRALVKENRELSRALLVDDLSGLANKKAHRMAIDSVDRDPHTAWLAFDGDRFKTLNDAYGHPTGDKAIIHFGDTIRAQAAKLDIPLRAFRPGGDEFAFAVPKARAAELMRAIEDESRFNVKRGDGPAIETKLTGAIGDTWDEADTVLKNTKEMNRQQDQTLDRGWRPEGPSDGLKLYSNPIGPALSLLKRYPSAAGVALVGMAMTESDNEQVQRAGVPVMALAALSAIGSDRLGAGADALGSRLVEQLRKTPEGTRAVRFFNPDALLTPEVRDAIREYERGRAQGVARATEFSGKAKKLGGAGDRAVSDVMENEGWEDTSGFTPKQTTDLLSVAGELTQEYERLTQAQVAAGTLAPEQARPDYAGPRRYAYFDALDALADRPSASSRQPGRTAKITGTKARTLDIPIREAEAKLAEAVATGDAAKITEAQQAVDGAKAVQMSQRVELGEIREASYRAAIGIEKAHANVAAAKLFETVRNVPGAVHPEWQSAVDELLSARDMQRTATTQADKDAAQLLYNESTVKLNEITRQFSQRGGEYVSLPDTPSLGVLRGAVVKRDIAHSLEGFGAPHTYGKMLRAWKEIKTVFNPGTSIGNILSNVTALHMGDVPVWLQPYYYTQAVKDLRNYGEATRTMAEAGVLNVNSVNALGQGEMGRGMRTEAGLEELLPTTRPETARVLRQNGITEHEIALKQWRRRMKGMAAGAALGAAKTYDPENPEDVALGAGIGAGLGALAAGRVGNMVRKVYDNEDNIARLAVFLRRRKLGDTVEQARDRAISSLGDFRSRSPALKMISSTVSPFIMYQAKAVPAFARNVVDHPWKYLTLIAAWGAVNEMSKQEMGEVPESDIPVSDRKTYGYFFPGFTQLPFGDEQGNKAAVDVSRWTPMSGVTTGAPPGSVPEAFSDNGSALVTPGGPVIDAALRGSNVDPYTKGPRLKRDVPTSENVATLAHDAADFVLPSAVGFHAERLKDDMNNEDWTKFKNDLLGPTGIKPKYVRPGAVAVDASYTLERSLRDMKQELKKDLRANKSEANAQVIVNRYTRRVATALANFKERIGTPPDAALVNEYLTPDP